MKKFTVLLGSVLVAMAGITAHAEVQNYLMDFNKSISTTGDWTVGTGWSHYQQSSGGSTASTQYTFYQMWGDNKSGTIKIGTQGELEDMLVTPGVKGKISIKAQAGGANATDTYIEFYKMGTLLGRPNPSEKILTNNYNSELLAAWQGQVGTNFITIDLPEFADYTMIGIKGNNVYIDDFKADYADIDYVSRLDLNNLYIPTTYFDLNSEGRIPVDVHVSITNTGDLPIEAGTPNYTFIIYDITNGRNNALLTAPISQSLESGKSLTDQVKIVIDPADYDGKIQLKAVENFSGSSKTLEPKEFTPIPYEPIVNVSFTGGALYSGASVVYPPTKSALLSGFTVKNDGAAPLEISGISLPAGLQLSGSTPTSVAPHQSNSFTVLMPEGADLVCNGPIVINSNAAPFTINFSGRIVAPDRFFLDGSQIPGDVISDANWDVMGISTANFLNNREALRAEGATASKLITPLINMESGDKLTFSAARRDNNPNLKIYTSTDRKNWTLLKTVEASELSNSLVATDMGGNFYYPFADFEVATTPGAQYFAFESSSIYLDNVLAGRQVALTSPDVVVKSQTASGVAIINQPWAYALKLYNASSIPVGAGSYTAGLYFDGQKVAEATAVELGAYADVEIDFSYTPREAGQKSVEVRLEGSNFSLTTEPLSLTIVEESSVRDVQVGTPNTAVNTVPYYLGFTYGEGEMIYTAEMLNLKPGTKIKSISLHGATAGTSTARLSMWLENTTDEAFKEPLRQHATDAMTSLFSNKTTSVPRVGTLSGSTITESGTIFTFTLSKPFTYDGTNLRIVTKSQVTTSYPPAVYFEADNMWMENAMGRASNYTLGASDNFAKTAMPVLYLQVESEPSVVNGTVTDENGLPVASLTVTAEDGKGAAYQTVTGSDGKYSLLIYQDMHPYVLKIDKPSYTPVRIQFTPAGSSTQNIQLEKARGLFVEDITVPVSAQRNSETTVSANVFNPQTGTQAADYEATLYFAGKPVATAQAIAFNAGETKDIVFTFTPHAVGSQEAYVKISHANGYETQSGAKSFTVDDENYGGLVQVGDKEDSWSGYAPFYGSAYGTQSEMIIEKDWMPFEAGTVINCITFRGWVSGMGGETDLVAYIENTDDQTLAPLASFSPRDVTKMTKIYDDTMTIGNGGSMASTVDVLVLPIEGGFTYTGGNLRLVVHTANKNEKMIQTQWEGNMAHNSDQHAYARTMSYSQIATGQYGNWTSSIGRFPTLYMDVETCKTLSGSVSGTGTSALEGVTVVLVSGNVQYDGQTDSDGNYRIKVVKSDLDYTATASLRGYREETKDVSFAQGNTTWDFDLTAIYDRGYAEGEWAAISLPFDMTPAQMAAVGEFYEFDGVKNGSIYCVEADGVQANRPYVFKALSSGNPFAEYAMTEDYQPEAETRDGITFVGADDFTSLKNGDGLNYFIINPLNGSFENADGEDVAIFTAYLFGDILDDSLMFVEGEANGVESIVGDDKEAAVYTIDGRRVNPSKSMDSGIYIVNGKKVMILKP